MLLSRMRLSCWRTMSFVMLECEPPRAGRMRYIVSKSPLPVGRQCTFFPFNNLLKMIQHQISFLSSDLNCTQRAIRIHSEPTSATYVQLNLPARWDHRFKSHVR